jgi:hypothetical protein
MDIKFICFKKKFLRDDHLWFLNQPIVIVVAAAVACPS